LGPAAVETFVKSPKQERFVNRLYGSGAGVPGYGGAAKETAACAGMTLLFAVAAVHGVVGVLVFGVLVYCTIAKRMDVDSVSEHTAMIIRRAMGWSTAAWKRRCDGGHDYAKGV
jgi:hypothetical protein